ELGANQPSPFLPTSARARAATLSGVNPRFSSTTFPGAEAPKRLMPTTSSAQRSQPNGDAASTASLGTSGGSTASRYDSSWASNSSQEGNDTTLVAMPEAFRRPAASTQTWTSLPVPTNTTSGS